MKKNVITLLIVILIIIIGIFLIDIDEIESPENDSEGEEVAGTYFQCEQGFIEATFNNEEDPSVELSLSDDRELTAYQVEAASGAKYETEDGLIFWTKGDEAFIEEDGNKTFQNCSTNFEEESFEIDDRLIGNWKWEKTTYSDDEEVVPTGAEFILSLTEEGDMAATTDCNNVSGNFNVSDQNVIEFFDLVSTKMYCEDSFEDQFNVILNNAESYSFQGDQLVITISDDRGTAFFSPEN